MKKSIRNSRLKSEKEIPFNPEEENIEEEKTPESEEGFSPFIFIIIIIVILLLVGLGS